MSNPPTSATASALIKVAIEIGAHHSICTPDRQRAMYDVFRAAGTAEEEEQFAFAIPIVGGGATWDDVLTKMADH